ncbi:hypothetical protein AMTRI_Chr01g137610 [Amborella trichopoda]
MGDRRKAGFIGLYLILLITILYGGGGGGGDGILVVESAPNTNITQVLCNSGVYTRGDPFTQSLDYVLKDIQSSTPSRPSRDYKTISPFPNAFAYARATCTPSLSPSDCATCLVSAVSVMQQTCTNRIGARAVLYDCSVRYEQYPFSD